MLNYLKKFAVDIFPSVAATVIGAYIVNHYIAAKPGTDVPPAPAAAASTTNPKAASEAKPAETNVSNLPGAGVKAKGISEKAIMEKTAAERPAVVEKAQEKTEAKAEAKAEAKSSESKSPEAKSSEAKSSEAKAAEAKSDAKPDAKSAEAPADAANASADPRRHQNAAREKEKIRVVLPSPVQPAASSAAPVVATAPAAPVETAVAPATVAPAAAPEERRDANDLARAAIERLRANSGEGAARVHETARAPDVSKEAPKTEAAKTEAAKTEAAKTDAAKMATAPVLRPLPPPIMVSAPPAGDPSGQQGSSQPRPPHAANSEANDPNRPTPPADIPLSRPLDLHAEAGEPSVRERASAAAEDALSTAKSLFHSVLPK